MVKSGTDDMLLCKISGPWPLNDQNELTELREPKEACHWTVPLVTITIEYGGTAPDAPLDKLIEVQKAA